MQNNYKKLEIQNKLPEELENYINQYINYLNTTENPTSEDYYQMEILMELNYCKREDLLPIEKIQELREYYVKGGIHNTTKII